MSVTPVDIEQMQLPDTAYNMWVRGELDDFVHAPEGHRVEVIGGRIVVSPAPLLQHGGIVQDIVRAVFKMEAADSDFPWECIQANGVDLFGAREGYIPDLILLDKQVYATARRSSVRYLVPDQVELVIEVTSPSNASEDRRPKRGHGRDRATKWNGYARAEVPYYLLIDRDPKSPGTTLYSIPDQGTGAYLHKETWEFGETVHLPEPFGLDIETGAWTSWQTGSPETGLEE
ncbi:MULTISPECIES: Uma2 family endonuclease [Thermomonosporaceae]|uniref:Uma2 family endonuclease n=1 Tax=Thermomonosporaceae TaxID=2012 RepID=UPI00255AFEA3|nr:MULTISPECIES: Uma2 family endonuclease [Thermomonosporaceae]MDL4771971.1 Uma2 family endonuclease [Actinomadura xylanilytica]